MPRERKVAGFCVRFDEAVQGWVREILQRPATAADEMVMVFPIGKLVAHGAIFNDHPAQNFRIDE